MYIQIHKWIISLISRDISSHILHTKWWVIYPTIASPQETKGASPEGASGFSAPRALHPPSPGESYLLWSLHVVYIYVIIW